MSKQTHTLIVATLQRISTVSLTWIATGCGCGSFDFHSSRCCSHFLMRNMNTVGFDKAGKSVIKNIL